MKQNLLERLRCPQSDQPLAVELDNNSGEIIEGCLANRDYRCNFIRNSIPNFAPESFIMYNYI